MHDAILQERTYTLISNTLGIEANILTGDMQLSELSRDSIQLFELVLAFEREFGLEASYDDLIRIITVEDIINYLSTRLAPVLA